MITALNHSFFFYYLLIFHEIDEEDCALCPLLIWCPFRSITQKCGFFKNGLLLRRLFRSLLLPRSLFVTADALYCLRHCGLYIWFFASPRGLRPEKFNFFGMNVVQKWEKKSKIQSLYLSFLFNWITQLEDQQTQCNEF